MPINRVYTPEEFPTHLASISRKDWQTLFQHLPELEAAKEFGRWQAPIEPDGTMHLPFVNYEPLVDNILQALYSLGLIINFDWSVWEEGIILLAGQPFHADDLDACTICKLITGIVRNDRFAEGVLLSRFQDGTMLILLKALQQRVQRIHKV